MRNFKKISIFLLLNIALTLIMHFLLAAPCRQKIYIDQIHRDNYSTLIVGQSHAAAALNPYLMDDESGKAFNAAHMMTPVRNLYFQIQEANRDGNLKRVFFEIDVFYFCSGATGEQVGTGMNLFPYLSPSVQLSYLKDFLFNANYNQVLFDYRLHPDTVRAIPDAVGIKLSSDYIHSEDPAGEYNEAEQYLYMGRGFRSHQGYTYAQHTPVQFSPADIDAESVDYLKKSADYCRENGIELVCFISALPPSRLQNENHGDVHNYFAELCREEGIEFIDANYIKTQYLPRKGEDFTDFEGHMMGYLADKQTEVFMDILESEKPQQYFEDSYEAVLAGIEA